MIKISKRVLVLLILALTVFYGNNLLAHADGNIIDSGMCGENLTWKLTKDGSLTISGTGEMSNFGDEYDDEIESWIIDTPWRKYNNDLKKLVIEEGVTSIGSQAFSGCKSLTGQLILPESITYIGEQAFEDCSGFNGDLVIPEGVSVIEYCAFSGCNGFDGELKLPASVTTIREYAFNDCSGFTGQLILPKSLTEIKYCAFYGCNSFTGNLVIPEKVSHISDEAFRECDGFNGRLVLPNSLTYIGVCAFYECSGFKGELVIPENLTEINFGTFWECRGLSGNLIIPEGVTKIGDNAFFKCKGFNGSLIIPESVTYIGEGAFEQCSKLSGELKIPESVKSIGAGAFKECKSFSGDLIIPEGVKKIEWGSFDECSGLTGNLVIPKSVKSIEDGSFSGCSGLTGDLVIPESVTSIGEYAFSGCSGLTGNLIIPENVTDIGEFAFEFCSGFTGDLVIPDGVKRIELATFQSCSGLTGNLIIPESVTTIEEAAFLLCSNLENVTIPQNVQIIQEAAFADVPLIHNLSNASGKPWDAIKVHNNSRNNCNECKNSVSAKRIWGKSRYMTSLAIADSLKLELGVNKFDAAIIANGQNFPDALAGSYLAAKKKAPILMINDDANNISLVQNYITSNVIKNGKIFILGGSAAVPESIENSLTDVGYAVKRLKGKDRYETNISILNEAGVNNEEIIVCTGSNFADSLSASALGLPMLLVNPNGNSLTDSQIEFLYDKNNQISIVGGEGAVSENYRKSLEQYDVDNKVDRVKGKSRYETSIAVARRYCKNPGEAVIAYAVNFPDGLCGGPLAYAKESPLILTASKNEAAAKGYIAEQKIRKATTLGGSGVLPDSTVKKVFGMSDSDLIRGTRYE